MGTDSELVQFVDEPFALGNLKKLFNSVTGLSTGLNNLVMAADLPVNWSSGFVFRLHVFGYSEVR